MLAIKYNNFLNAIRKYLIKSNNLTPRIYVLLKVHKTRIPLRPIGNTIGSPSYLLTKFLAQNLKPLVGLIDSFVKEANSFIKEVKDVRLDLGDVLVGFEVVSLYTKIPIEEVIDVIN